MKKKLIVQCHALQGDDAFQGLLGQIEALLPSVHLESAEDNGAIYANGTWLTNKPRLLWGYIRTSIPAIGECAIALAQDAEDVEAYEQLYHYKDTHEL